MHRIRSHQLREAATEPINTLFQEHKYPNKGTAVLATVVVTTLVSITLALGGMKQASNSGN